MLEQILKIRISIENKMETKFYVENYFLEIDIFNMFPTKVA